MRRNNDFRALYREGVKVRLQGVVLYGRFSGFETHRMGIVASRKIGSAVVRNRFKRRMRTFFEELKTQLAAEEERIPNPQKVVDQLVAITKKIRPEKKKKA